jgi:hypothetical protein
MRRARRSTYSLPSVAAALVLALAWSAGVAATPAAARIVDEGGYFSRDAIDRAESVISQARQRHDRNIVVETYQTPPADLLRRFNPQDRQQFFKAWVDERAKTTTTADVFVLICRDPGRLQVGIGRQAGRIAFSQQDDERLNQMMAGAIKAGDADRALLEGVQFIAQRFDANAGPERAAPGTPGALPPGERTGAQSSQPPARSDAPAPSNAPAPAAPGADRRTQSPGGGVCGMGGGITGWLCLIIGGLAIFTVIRGFARRRQMGGGGGPGFPMGGAPGQPGYGQPGYGQPGYGQPGYDPRYQQGGAGGGGFGRGMGGGLLGGLLGGVLGGAAYDHLRGGGNAAHGATTDPGATGASPDPGSSGADLGTGGGAGGLDAYSSGTDLDSGGGGDFGGGGGDFSSGSDL